MIVLGEAYMESKQYELALSNYKTSLEKDAGNINAQQRIAALEREM